VRPFARRAALWHGWWETLRYPPYGFSASFRLSDYRRNGVPGGTYFFTVNLHDRSSDLLVAEIEALRLHS